MSKMFFFILILFQIYTLKSTLEEEKELNEDDIIIIHTNDVHCGINDNIGYDGLMLYKKELQKKYKYVITVDVGDHIAGDSIGVLSKGLDIIKIMNKIGYNVSIIGNHEFDYGIDSLYKCNENLEYGYITANFRYRKNKTTIFEPYKILEVGDKKIGFIGVTTPQVLIDSNLHNLVDEDGEMIYDFLEGNEGKNLYENVQEYINQLKEDGIDYIIILDHIGSGGDSKVKYTSTNLLSNISGIDAMLDGHTHNVYNDTKKDKNGNDIPIVQTGTKLSNIGLLKIKKDNTIISELISEVPEPDEKNGTEKVERNNKERWVDAEMKNFLIDIINSHSDEFNELIGYTDFDLIVNTDPLKDHHKHTSRSEESTLGDLVTDSIRYVGKSNISMVNAASIRDDLLKGNITYRNILNILPYSSNIIVKEVLGKDILDALELGVRLLPEKSPKFPQVSGISFNVDINIKSSVEVDENNIFIGVKGKRRVSNVKVGENEIDLNKKYKISLGDYIGNGGDGYCMFSKYEITLDTQIVDNQALIMYIKDELKGKIPDYYRKTQGRIVINSKNEDDKNKDNTVIIIIIIISSIIVIILIIILILFIIKKKKAELIENEDSNLKGEFIVN